ncbi:hypothetical protein ACLB2K_026289 [Fragaria x ananassa]
MHTRRTVLGELNLLNSEIERTCKLNMKQSKDSRLSIEDITAGSTSSQEEEHKQIPSSPTHSIHEDEQEKVEEPPKAKMTLKDSFVPTATDSPSCIDYTPPGNHSFSIPVHTRDKRQDEKDVLETFRKVQVNIPLLDAINQVPKYAKFLKELCTKKKKFKANEIVALSEKVLAVLQQKLPPKLKGPRRFTIPCTIGANRFDHSLLDLGALINLMSYYVFVALKLADFLVLEMEEALMPTSLPLILGRPFMATAHTNIDVFNGTLSIEVFEETITFRVFVPLKSSPDEQVHFCDDGEVKEEV